MAHVQSGDALGASYRLEEPLGSGAVGEVWRVSSASGGPDLAAKLLRPEHAQDPTLVERFVRERSVLLALRHPNIVAVRDLVVEGDRLAIVMDYVTGGSVRDLLESRLTLPAGEALALCAEVLDALASAHAGSATHRDIKPDNVLLAESWRPGLQGAVKVSDFGIASVIGERTRHTTGMVGTPQYMPPELLSQGEIGPAADIYATGIMLYELVAGRTPFAGAGTDFTLAYRHVTTLPPRLDLPEELWAALEKTLSKNPRERPGAAQAAAQFRRLAREFADLPALSRSVEPEDFQAVDRPATVLRGAPAEPEAGPTVVARTPESPQPELGPAGSRTIVRPMPRRDPARPVEPVEPENTASKWSAWLTRKVLVLGAVGLVLVVGLVFGIVLTLPQSSPAVGPRAADATATQQDVPLPSGLSVSRAASYDAAAGEVKLTITYSAQKAPLRGPFLEVLPGAAGSPACPPVTWENAAATRNKPSLSGVSANCGWSVDGVRIPAQGSVEVGATIPVALAGENALDEWLDAAAAATTEATADDSVEGSAYPVQRLRGIQVQTPARTVSQTALPVTLVPVWPSGPDVLGPLYKSPATGKPSEMLTAIAGGEKGVRFSDGCSGGLAVSSDGLVVTALAVAPSCVLRAVVGNFTDLASEPFGITTRE
ncbi:serine/threonine-protein kinase [Paeniglutamicibacter kerguelensis]|uniref:non-specific serine/threonine protein kinase n=1 Tax=Paeniglutamicibacter kerguelensis TaxID=254788 RepID=A0ABS4XK26_9MICC|nr:serine/threonine-protein kinase [Paeniglutamicibacter kerguelensis]MBP2388758.1 serine/threonine-protein kinase [Paeniglutamicibacter kerguelensis]